MTQQRNTGKKEIKLTNRANEANLVKFANELAELLARIKSVQEYALFVDAALAPNSTPPLTIISK